MATAPQPSDRPHPIPDPESTMSQMFDKARDIIIRSGLDAVVDAGIEAIAKVAAASDTRPPDELLVVLRSPIGPPRVVELRVDGKTVWARVTPSGRNDPIAEYRTWQCIRDVVLGRWAA